jgi:hypothetical protein
LKIIYEYKQKGLTLTAQNFIQYDYKDDKYIKPMILKPKERFYLPILFSRLNLVSFENFAKKLYGLKYENNLSRNYLDLFNR